MESCPRDSGQWGGGGDLRRLCLVVSESEAVATLPGPVWVGVLAASGDEEGST